MCLKPNRSHLGLVIGLLLTAFVTACVKNASKDNDPREVAFKELSASELQSSQVNGLQPIEIRDDSDVSAAELTQTYTFSINEIRELRMRQGGNHNEGCTGKGPFLPSYKIVGPDGEEHPMRGRRDPLLLVPGSYLLKVDIENGGLCRKISFDLHMNSRIREDLTLTQKSNMGFICNNVEENGRFQFRSSVRVNTDKLQLVKYVRRNNGRTDAVPVETDDQHCQLELSANTQCVESPLIADVEAHPIMATQRKCHIEDQRRDRGFAHLLVKEGSGSTAAIDFTCQHKRNNITMRLSDCHSVFNLGKSLPTQPGQTDLMIRRHRVLRMNFDPVYSLINDRQIPDNIFVSVARKITEEDVTYYEPALPSFDLISKENFMDGQFAIRVDGMSSLFQDQESMENLVLVFSSTDDFLGGLFYMDLKGLCSEAGNSVVKMEQGTSVSLCE